MEDRDVRCLYRDRPLDDHYLDEIERLTCYLDRPDVSRLVAEIRRLRAEVARLRQADVERRRVAGPGEEK